MEVFSFHLSNDQTWVVNEANGPSGIIQLAKELLAHWCIFVIYNGDKIILCYFSTLNMYITCSNCHCLKKLNPITQHHLNRNTSSLYLYFFHIFGGLSRHTEMIPETYTMFYIITWHVSGVWTDRQIDRIDIYKTKL